jgi:hypothetical protein
MSAGYLDRYAADLDETYDAIVEAARAVVTRRES